MKDFNFDLLVSKDVSEEVVSLREQQSRLIAELGDVTKRLANYELHVLIHDALTHKEITYVTASDEFPDPYRTVSNPALNAFMPE